MKVKVEEIVHHLDQDGNEPNPNPNSCNSTTYPHITATLSLTVTHFITPDSEPIGAL